MRTAWLCDDAYISFRTVRNFVGGEGLVWNLGERVQVFTHPLWLLLVSAAYALTHEIYFTTLALSGALALATAAFLGWRLSPTPAAGAFGLALLCASRSVVDYSTSGMENVLAHLLLVLLAAEALRAPPRPFRVALLASLLCVNRLDAVLVAGPIAFAAVRAAPRGRRLVAVALGLTPLVAWEAFAVIYYGFPFPNTAYAKLASGLPWLGRIGRGGVTLLTSTLWDPLLAVAGLAGFAVAIRRRPSFAVAIALATLYVVWMGGDFMAGRFLTVPFVVAAAALVTQVSLTDRRALLAVAAATLLGLGAGQRASLLAGPGYGEAARFWPNMMWNIADERGVYYKVTGLLREGEALTPPHGKRIDAGAELKPGEVAPVVTIGMTGWAAPPDAILIDRLALADPLLARLPPRENRRWRPGHLERAVPAGYLESRRRGVNVIPDVAVAWLYDELALITRGPLFTRERWRAIWTLNRW